MTVRDLIARDARIETLRRRLADSKTPLAAHGLWGSSAPAVAAVLAEHIGATLLYITAHLDQADDARDDMDTVLGRLEERGAAGAEVLPAFETLPGEGSGSGEINAERTRLCSALLAAGTLPSTLVASFLPCGGRPAPRARPFLIVAPIQALLQPVPSPESLAANTLTLAVGDVRRPSEITAFLLDRGFQRLDQVEEPGDFALRGGILDIFASPDTDPVRIEFFGDRIESIRPFEVGTQRSTRTLVSTRLTLPPDPARLRPAQTAGFLDYLPSDAIAVVHEPLEVQEMGRLVLDRLGNPVGHYSVDAVMRNLSKRRRLYLSRFPLAGVDDADSFALQCDPLPPFEPKASDAVAQLLAMAAGQHVVVYCDNTGEQERLRELIQAHAGAAAPAGPLGGQDRPVAAPALSLHRGRVHSGFTWKSPAGVLSVVPHHELFRRYTQKRRLRRAAAARPIESFLDLAEGDYVVHVVHGIARYVGMRTMRKGDSAKSEEFLTLKFADDATMHVPVSQIDLVQKYVGAKAVRPPLSKLGGTRWAATKARVEEAVDDLASDLLRIQAVRASQPGVAYPNDTHWQVEFENAFLYTETPDQLSANREIKQDQSRERPMDRLLCGDVGYGKTELAMRAAFKVVEFGKQVAVLVPTTVLAEQHLRTFRERMADYPFVIECLNRFRSPSEQKQIISAVRKGQIDVLIGTHRILSRDVEFADLGLVVVDEEQRFGVEHKERLKRLRATVDVLTMTATPIPRTLHMAMVGLRDISSLATPPMDRRAISTRVSPWNDEMIREAIVRELNREGQIYFVHNRVRTLPGIAARIGALVPEARLAVGHGQMPGDELEEVMLRFVRHEADVLVCTSIIEAGLDIPNANTIFIDRVETFGLADLHQLRGRVGRYKHRAYCYLLLGGDRPITSSAAKRLKAIEEYSELGAGFRIAMRDLEIRGAGNLLGPEQSGNIAAIGYELYCQLLEKAVRRLRGEPYIERVSVHLELDVEAYIPRNYIASDRQRMDCYRRLALCRTPEEVEQLERDMIDAFGRLPETVETLLTLADIRVRAAGWGIRSIIRKEPDLIFSIEGEVRRIEPLFAGSAGSVRIADGRTLHWRLPDNYFASQTLLRILRNLFRRKEAAGPAQAPTSPTAPAKAVGTARRRSSARDGTTG